MVSRLLPLYPAQTLLRQHDILTAIDGIPIGNDGTIPFRKRERVLFDNHLLNKFPGDVVRFSVLRDGEACEAPLPAVSIPPLVSVHEYDRHPAYFIYAGLVFMALAQPYLHEWGEHWVSQSPRRLVEKALNGNRREHDEQVIVLSKVLTDELNYGYQRFVNLEVLAYDGQPVRNLRHLHELVHRQTGEYDEFELDNQLSIILNRRDAAEASPRILERHRVPAGFASHLPSL
eukprot:Unigene12193_Nuclearia_a/m.37052 Unigene12193_Nuclearia_a/g.37052  ORF Unigene12193_Nuclearia_a/g.37052 Unigene12193_Nuclearia_a/m.37052 type:complete len:231 (-) Unigene12193_Nuclearia_a:52-744(-)